MKKIVSLIVAITLVFACVFSANATTGITAEEQKIIDALSRKINLGQGTVIAEIPAIYINEAEDYLIKADLNTEQINEILANIASAYETLENADAVSFGTVNATVKNEILKKIEDAASVVNADLVIQKGDKADKYDVTLNFSGDSTVPGYSSNDVPVKIPVVGSNIIKQTGVEGNMMLVIVAASVVMMGLAFVVVSACRKVTDK